MAKKNKKRTETTKTKRKGIARSIMMYKVRDGDIDHYESVENLVRSIRKKPRRAIRIVHNLFKFGFIIDDRAYYIKGGKIIGKHWTHDLSSVIERGQDIPRILVAITNILAKVQETLENTKTDYDSWIGSIWSRKDEPEHGLYDATNARIGAYINNQERGIEYRYQLSELRAIITKLKGLMQAITMQHSLVVAMVYHSKNTSSVFSDAMGSMVNTIAAKSSMIDIDMDDDSKEYTYTPSTKKKKKGNK